ncbi:hypothetical protein J2S76_000206 [Ancylobacter vacuolatus]|uniref:Uncharacterized protein n=1 Tax=Ancylobacter vacuolatus TaxID=223389 RepID=A0ABU0DBW4_9HYPH|nr:hypothetical protein [Ancylobacter vacuolatus]
MDQPTTRRETRSITTARHRRDHPRALAQRVEVAEGEVRFMGSKTRLLQTPVSRDGVNAVLTGTEMAEGVSLQTT